MVGEVSSDDLRQPFPDFGNGLVLNRAGFAGGSEP
jgi:hypothetical protein